MTEKDFSQNETIRSKPRTWCEDVDEKLPILQKGAWKRKRVELEASDLVEMTPIEESGEVEAEPTPAIEKIQSLQDIAIEMGTICSEIVEDPQKNLEKIKAVLNKVNHENARVRSVACISLVSVFVDILPSYRIRPLTESEQQEKVSKDVKMLRNYEQSLLSKYHSFLKSLDGASGIVPIQALCSLLLKLTHFNFRKNIMMQVGKGCFSPDPAIAEKCQSCLSELFIADESGEPSLEAALILSQLVKQHMNRNKSQSNCVESLKCLLNLRLREEFHSVEDASNNEKTLKRKRHLSKKAKKALKEEKQLEKELKEAEAVVSFEEKHKWASIV